MNLVFGMDIGGTSIKAVALECGQADPLCRVEEPSHASVGPGAVRAAVLKTFELLSAQIGRPSLLGIGCAGSVEPERGIVRNSPNFKDWKDIPFGSWISKDVGLSVQMENDANCAVYAESQWGSAKGEKNVVLLTFGTGIGGGVVIGGQIYRGSTGSAGELGHFSIRADGVRCNCGNRGCFERYCSATALTERLPNYSSRQIFEKRHEEPFSAVIGDFKANLKVGLTSIANVFDPDCILMGGGMAVGISLFLDELIDHLRRHAFPAVGSHVELRTVSLGNWSGALGAALLVLKNSSSESNSRT